MVLVPKLVVADSSGSGPSSSLYDADIAPVAILSDLDGTLIDSKASVIRAFEWWAGLRALPPGVADRLPHGRTSTSEGDVRAEWARTGDRRRSGNFFGRRVILGGSLWG